MFSISLRVMSLHSNTRLFFPKYPEKIVKNKIVPSTYCQPLSTCRMSKLRKWVTGWNRWHAMYSLYTTIDAISPLYFEYVPRIWQRLVIFVSVFFSYIPVFMILITNVVLGSTVLYIRCLSFPFISNQWKYYWWMKVECLPAVVTLKCNRQWRGKYPLSTMEPRARQELNHQRWWGQDGMKVPQLHNKV